MAVEYGIVNKSGAFFSYQDQRLAQGRDNARAYLKDHPEITAEIDQQVRARLFAPKDMTQEEEKAVQDQIKEEEDDLALLEEDI
jgi:recombination protein RecA